jgi:hypothetical protein
LMSSSADPKSHLSHLPQQLAGDSCLLPTTAVGLLYLSRAAVHSDSISKFVKSYQLYGVLVLEVCC